MHRAQRRIVLIAVAALSGAPLAHGQDLVVGQVASQTSPVTAANSKGMYTGMKTYFNYVNARAASMGE